MIYRLILDENGQEDCTDFTDIMDAEEAFMKASRRKSVFSATVQAYNPVTFESVGGVIYHYEQ